MALAQSQLLAIPSPSSSSSATSSDSGSGKSSLFSHSFLQRLRGNTYFTFSGTDTIKRGASPSASISSNSRFKEPTTTVSYVTQKPEVQAKIEKIEDKRDEKVDKVEKIMNVDKVEKAEKAEKEENSIGLSQSEPPIVSRASSNLLSDYSVKDSSAQKSSLFSSDIYALSSKYKDSTYLATTRSSPIAYTTASSAAASASNLEDVLANYNKPSFSSSYSSASRSEALPAYSSYSSTNATASAHLSSLLKSDTTTTKSDSNNDSAYSYQFSSSHLKSPATTSAATLEDTSSRFNDEASSTAYSSILNKISSSLSPFRTMITSTNTSTLPHLGRANNLSTYQSESSPVTKSSASNPSTYPSPASTTSNVYGTLPKTTSSSPYKSYYTGDSGDKFTATSLNYNSDFSNSPPTTSNGANGNGQYRVQYSSTNPFLSAFEPPSTTNSTVDVSSTASIMRGNVGNIINRFDRLDSEEDLK